LMNCPNNPIVVQRLKTEKRMLRMFLDDLENMEGDKYVVYINR
jgi:hypothetical protein